MLKRDRRPRPTDLFLVLAAILAISFGVYVSDYYRAESMTEEYLAPDGTVTVEQTDYGWFLDGPSEENALIFYPGAKVDEESYLPILHRFAQEGMDVCLVKMPFRLAVFGIDKAADVMAVYEYENWYIGGHSLGGAMAAGYAADHGDELRGVILLAAYATKKLDDSLVEIVVYGSEDRVLRDGKIEKGREFAPDLYFEHVIEGGNHAQFGNYGVQKGDGAAMIAWEEQQAETVRFVMENK